MRKLLVSASAIALAACSQVDEDEAVADDMAAAEPAPAPAATAAEDPAGTYDVTMADGSMGTTTINADGTFTDTDADGNTVNGTFVRRGEQDCFDPEGDEAEVCWTVQPPAADGSFVATAPDGTSVTVRRRAAEAPTT